MADDAAAKMTTETASAVVRVFHHADSSTCQYVVSEKAAKEGKRQCVIIDSCWDYDQASCTISTEAADELLAYVRDNELEIAMVCDTHPHADHLSAAQYIKRHAKAGAQYTIGEHVKAVQTNFKPVYNFDWLVTDGSQFDRLLADNESFECGSLKFTAWHVPGHTPACIAYVLNDTEGAFVGDTLFQPGSGTARCDFVGGSAAQLYDSTRRLLTKLPADAKIFLCHDYPSARELIWCVTVAEQRANNKHVKDGVSKDEFVKMRTERDATLKYPRLLLPSIQVNINGAELPPAEGDGKRRLKLPVTDNTPAAAGAKSAS